MDILINGVFNIISFVINIYMWIIIISVLISWVRPDPYSPIVIMLYRLSEPSIGLVRRYIPTNFNGIDLAPFIVVLVCIFLDSALIPFIKSLIL